MPNSLCCCPTSEPLVQCWLLCFPAPAALLLALPSALTPSHRDGSRAGGWQPPSLHLTCPGLLAAVLLYEAAAPERWQPCGHPAARVLSLWSTSGLHHRSLPRCAGPCLLSCAGAAWLSPSVPFTCSAPPASDRSHAGHTLWLHTRTPEPARCSPRALGRQPQPLGRWLQGLHWGLAGSVSVPDLLLVLCMKNGSCCGCPSCGVAWDTARLWAEWRS